MQFSKVASRNAKDLGAAVRVRQAGARKLDRSTTRARSAGKRGLPLPQNRAVNVEIERYSVVPAITTTGVERDPNDPITSDRRRNLITPIGIKTG
jgi:hypothetical protein